MAKEDLVEKYGEKEIRENFIPIDEKDTERALDVPVKPKPKTEIIEKIGNKVVTKRTKPKTRKTKTTKKTKITKNNWYDNFKIPGNKKLKSSGPILIITEKPQASQKIANALSDNGVDKKAIGGIPYYEIQKDGKDIQVVCAVGHLFTVAQVKPRNKWPTVEIAWAPNYLIRKSDFTKKYYEVIAKLCKNASKIIVATDYDIEGEVIGMNVVRYICNQEDAERMKFSTLTSEEIKKAYDNRSKTLDWGQAIAGETRHFIDWIYGINLSRALMKSVTEAGSFRLMSIGRVQGPALNIVVKKEHEIAKFKPEKYWQVFLDVSQGNKELEVKFVNDIKKQKELEKFDGLQGKKAIAQTKKSTKKITPPVPFDLTSLQTEAYKWYKITPTKTLQIAQKLYLAGIISYPRTSSQKIPKEIGYEKILKRVAERFKLEKFVKRKTPIEGKKSDPAHPSIYPTGEFHEIEDEEQKIYHLIVKRFVSCFCDDAIFNDKKVLVNYNDLKFEAKGMGIEEKGWINVYPYSYEEKEIPDMEGEVNIDKIKIQEKLTQPPHRYTPASIISILEKKNLGTKATRASIIETLYDRGYVKDRSIQATSLGISLIETLEENCPVIINENLTRHVENELENIRKSKKPKKEEERILDETKQTLEEIGTYFEKNSLKIGQGLIKATEQLWEQEKKDAEIFDCPECKKGKLAIKYNKTSRRAFIACNAYPDCKTTFTLPPYGAIKKTEKLCEECGFPLLMSLRKGKKPWIFCFNPNCPSKKK